MASIILNMPLNIGTKKGPDCLSHEKLKLKICPLICSLPHPHMLVVKASTSDGPFKKSGMSAEECEAAIVAGNIPEVPPVPPIPAPPPGTPQASFDIRCRPRRNRRSPVLRSAFQETSLSAANFVYPLFIHEGEEDMPISAIPGCYMLGWRHGLLEEVSKAHDVGVNNIMLYPKVPYALKTPTGDEAYNDNGLVPRTIRLLKDKYPDLVIYSDVGLDLYSSDGHDGIVGKDGVICNDESVHPLCKQAVSQARAGADIISPRDIINGRIEAIRLALDAEGFKHVSILSCIAKYPSLLYGPFREALGLKPCFGDEKAYQAKHANYGEILTKMGADASKGADILLVEPGLPCLDVIRLLRDNSPLPIAAYQVAGEYLLIKGGDALKMIDVQKAMMESLVCLRRAGADIIITSFALEAARCMCGGY